MPPRGTICCRGRIRESFFSRQKLPRQQIVPGGGILLASLTEKRAPTPNKTAKEARLYDEKDLLQPKRTCSDETDKDDLPTSRTSQRMWHRTGQDQQYMYRETADFITKLP
ncbi:hypothetical protein Bbelb_303450 [Branchiostoma belcheri]|nr:hypothetical protein Bbelb_303450 [Branchiostoma belcheri]